MTSNITANELIHILNTIVSKFDLACKNLGVEKVKTIGGFPFINPLIQIDCYVAVCGVPVFVEDHAEKMLLFAREMLRCLAEFNDEYDYNLNMRIGIHVGSVVAGSSLWKFNLTRYYWK